MKVERLVWFGVLGAPAAWAAQHVTGIALTQAACNTAFRGDVALVGLTIAVMAVAVAVALLAELCAVTVFRRTRDAGDDLPGSRIHFMAIVGMTVGPLFLTMILMSGLAAAITENCGQS